MPLVVPTEVVLIFSGYLALTGKLSIPILVVIAVVADIVGTTLWYSIFLFFGEKIRTRYDHRFPKIFGQIQKIEKAIERRGLNGYFLFRLIPFARGYPSLVSGLLGIPYKKLAPRIVASSLVWSGIFITLGYLGGNQWNKISVKTVNVSHVVVWALLILVGFLISKKIMRRRRLANENGS